MASTNEGHESLIANAPDLIFIGQVLHNYFHQSYYKLEDSSAQNTEHVIAAITDVYSKVGVKVDIYNTTPQSLTPRVGDIVVLPKPTGLTTGSNYYSIVSIAADGPNTFPKLPSKTFTAFNSGIETKFLIIRPDFTGYDKEIIEDFISRKLPAGVRSALAEQTVTFTAPLPILQDGVLQIGDVVFVIDPQQLVFTTQNDYQIYPTMRTHGNPKLPSMSQIKNISVTLIFANESAVNYQLLNLYAMYRRTPFVNIRNNDINDFFSELHGEQSDFISVALESINIQSIDGFPNSLQAQVTFLPFDPRPVMGGMRALRSMADVRRQQAYIESTVEKDLIEKSNEVMNSTDMTNTRLLKQMKPQVTTSFNFKESLPFRSFYQSLIKERSFVTDEHGSPVPVTNLSDQQLGLFCSLETFRPTKDENFLHHYATDANINGIDLSYNYIADNFRSASKAISKERLARQSHLLKTLTDIVGLTPSREDLASAFFTTLHTQADEISRIEYSLAQWDTAITQILTRSGVELPNVAKYKLGGLFNCLGVLTRRQALKSIIGTEAPITLYRETIGRKSDEKTVLTDDFAGLTKGLVVFGDDGIQTIRQYFINWEEYIRAGGQERVTQYSDVLAQIADIANEALNGTYMVLSDNQGTSSLEVKANFFKPETVSIDNKNDIIVGWSLTFANKFVQMPMLAFKYPFYQHIGSEDVNLTLRIHSTNNEFKNKLHLLSERIYESTKIVTLTSPELIKWIDPRVSVDCPSGHVFRAFGVHKIVYNGSNTTSIEGSPGSWMSVVNLTEANFNLDEFHKVQMLHNNNDLQIALMQFLLRLYINEKNELEVRTPLKDGTPVTDMERLVKMSFVFSTYGEQFTKHLKSIEEEKQKDSRLVSTGAVLGQEYKSQIAIFKNLMSFDRDDVATSALNNLLADPASGNLDKILRTLVYSYNSVLEKQLQALKNIVKNDVDFIRSTSNRVLQSQRSQFYAMGGLVAFTAALIVGLPLIAASGAVITVKAAAAAALGGKVAGSVLGTAAGGLILEVADAASAAGTQAGINKLKETFSGAFSSIIENFKQQTLLHTAQQILNDPVVANKLMGKEIAGSFSTSYIDDKGNTVDINVGLNQLLLARSSSETINCYPDFDIRVISNTAESLTELPTNLRVGPDFFLRNEVLTGQALTGYLSEAASRLIDTTKMCRMLAIQENADVLQQYDALRHQITGLSNITELEKDIGYLGSLEQSMKDITSTYISISMATADSDKKDFKDALTEDQKATIRADFDAKYKIDGSEKDFDQEAYKNFADQVMEMRSIRVDKDVKILDLIEAARRKAMLEIMFLYAEINSFMSQSITQSPDVSKTLGVISAELAGISLADINSDGKNAKVIVKLQKTLNEILLNFNDTGKLNTTLGKYTKHKSGLSNCNDSTNNKKAENIALGLPANVRLENYIGNKIGDFIRLSSFLQQAKANPRSLNVSDLAVLGEAGMIGYWNWQELEANFKRLDMLNSLASTANMSTSTLKMFPTFKFYFIEEDSGLIRRYDEIFTYDAIQSIEIVKSKDTPGSTAVVRLSNMTGTLTDSLSLHREAGDLLTKITNSDDNEFFGTLNIKPGCGIVIKMGYAAHSDTLPDLFAGRIVEMSVGNNIELVCQSYGTQLNYQILAEKFSFFSKEKGHGEIAIAALDLIPGLEKLGKKYNIGDAGGVKNFNSSNIANYRGSVTDRFLMSHLFGKVMSSVYGAPNPRDENIFLPFDPLGAGSLNYRPTFDWTIYNQSVWQVLKELSLYYQNTITCTKLFNSDNVMSVRDLRETIIVGNKSGYYKSTDAFSLSTLNIKSVDAIIDDWKKIKAELIPLLVNTNNMPFKVLSRSPGPKLDVYHTNSIAASVSDVVIFKEDLVPFRNLFLILQNKLAADVLIKHILDKLSLKPISGAGGFIADLYNTKFKRQSIDSQLLFDLFQFSRLTRVPIDTTPDYNFHSTDFSSQKLRVFESIVINLRKILKDKTLAAQYNNFDLLREEFYMVSTLNENTDEKLARDPRYTKIQQQHLITDETDILSNNISLSDTFKNQVNLFFNEEPTLVDQHSLTTTQWEKASVFTVKAFGDQKDEYTRPLDSYQKNVDTNFYDCNNSLTAQFQKYTRIYADKNGSLKTFLNGQDINTTQPQWNMLPAFVTVAINLLKGEVSRVYQGTLEVVGNPGIDPLDIVHIEDYTNDMHGAVEIAEVIHSFTPDRGFRTILTPSMITYDRDPIQAQDLQVISEVFRIASSNRRLVTTGALGAAGPLLGLAGYATIAGVAGKIFQNAKFLSSAMGSFGSLTKWAPGFWGKIPNLLALGFTAFAGADAINRGVIGAMNKRNSFIYDSFAKIWGRDCVNFTTLIYQGQPFITGFGGVDYSNLKTLINHSVEDSAGTLTRLSTFRDPFMAYFDPSYGVMNIISGKDPFIGLKYLPGSTASSKMGLGSALKGR